MNLVPEFDPLFFSEAALRMRGYRQQILSSNMANVDTPGYKSRDVLFSQALREQLEGTAYSNALPLAATSGRHYRIGGSLPGAPALLYRLCSPHLMETRWMWKRKGLTLQTTQYAQRPQ
jgi:flagellar basal-body rod protein FlgB